MDLSAILDQLASRPGEHILRAWDGDSWSKRLESLDPAIRPEVSKCAWSEGHCTSETCQHVSHDPHTWGDHVMCMVSLLGSLKLGETYFDIYLTPNGEVLGVAKELYRNFNSSIKLLCGFNELSEALGVRRARALRALLEARVGLLRQG